MKSKVALWNKVADKHVKGQAMNPFSNDKNVSNLNKPAISKEEYGRPPKGSLSELRALKASIQVNREILQLCEVIHQTGERLFTTKERPDDPRIAISFGELFTVSLVILFEYYGKKIGNNDVFYKTLTYIFGRFKTTVYVIVWNTPAFSIVFPLICLFL